MTWEKLIKLIKKLDRISIPDDDCYEDWEEFKLEFLEEEI